MASRRAYVGAQYLPTAPAGTRTTSPACASTVTPPDSTNSCPSITKLYSLCGCSSVHDSAVSSHSNNAGSDRPPCSVGVMTRQFGAARPLHTVRGYFVGVFATSFMFVFPLLLSHQAYRKPQTTASGPGVSDSWQAGDRSHTVSS